MTTEEKSWKDKALEAAAILKKIMQPPLQYATVTNIGEETVDIALTGGNSYVVNFNPQLKGKFQLGQTVRISPESLAVIDIAGEIKNRTVTTISDILADGRVKINVNGTEKVIQSSVSKVKIGDSVLVDSSYNVVVENIGNSTKAYRIDKVPIVPWSSIGGLDNTIEEIKDVIELPYAYSQIYSEFPSKKPAKGMLLHGPPGCGKTLLGKAIAYDLALKKKEKTGGELNGYFLYVAGPEFLQKYVGVGEAKVRELFANARETAAQNGDPVVIFIDEPEAVLRQRGTGISTDATDSIVNQVLVEMDGLKSLENILVLYATNRADLLDSALVRPERINRKIYVPRPDKEGAEQIFNIYLKDVPVETRLLKRIDAARKDFAKVAASEVFDTQRPMLQLRYRDGSSDVVEYKHIFSGASVVSIVDRATDYAIKRGIKGEKPELIRADIATAVEKEYQENRQLINQVTKYDIQSVAKNKFDQLVEVIPFSQN